MNPFRKNIALVLSGGGARGMAHIGVIEELERRGLHIHAIAGTSMGALVGGVYALGKMQEYKEWLYGLDMLKVLNLFDFTFSMQGFVKGDKVLTTMREFIPDKNIEELDISYRAVAADILNKKEVVFSKGSVYHAIRASMAIPTVFTPVKTEDGLLVDGGVVNNIPLNRVERKFADYLVAVDINADIPSPIKVEVKKKEDNIYFQKMEQWKRQINETKPWGGALSSALNMVENFFDDDGKKKDKEKNEEKDDLGYFDIVNQSINFMTYHIGKMTLQQSSPDILIQISRDICETFDFYKAKEVVEAGRNAAAKSLDEFF